MSHVIAVSNQKGGVGKTTSAINLGAELALLGRKVLLIDLDPQGNATSGIGVEPAAEGSDIYDVFFGRISLASILVDTQVEGLKVAPSSKDLVGVEVELGKTPGRELILKSQIKLLRNSFDYILIDCPPSLGILTLNALGTADSVVIPLQAEYYALEGISALMQTVEFVKATFNPDLDILGVFLTMFDLRTNLSRQVEDEVRSHFGKVVFKTRIPRSIRLSEAPSHAKPIAFYDPESFGAKAYHQLAVELDKRCVAGDKSDVKLAVNS